MNAEQSAHYAHRCNGICGRIAPMNAVLHWSQNCIPLPVLPASSTCRYDMFCMSAKFIPAISVELKLLFMCVGVGQKQLPARHCRDTCNACHAAVAWTVWHDPAFTADVEDAALQQSPTGTAGSRTHASFHLQGCENQFRPHTLRQAELSPSCTAQLRPLHEQGNRQQASRTFLIHTRARQPLPARQPRRAAAAAGQQRQGAAVAIHLPIPEPVKPAIQQHGPLPRHRQLCCGAV